MTEVQEMLEERNAVEAEQVKVYVKDANDLNLAGLVVFSLLVYVVHDLVPAWTWVPMWGGLVLVTLVRGYLIFQFRRAPDSRSSRFWMNSQAVGGAMAGICWGTANTALLSNLPITYQLFVLTVAVVVAATATLEGFTLVLPPRYFTLASITPLALWSLTVADRFHIVIGVLLLMFIPVTIVIATKKNRIFVEVTRLRLKNERLVHELTLKQEMLESASKSKSRFLAAASHDLRQPLAALMIFLEQLELERQLSASGKDVLEHARQATASLCSLLDGLLDISRLDGQAIRINIKAFNIHNLFQELEEEFRPLAEQKGITLKFVSCTAIVESDVIMLMQILRNLISNAVRYTSTGRVLVGCRRRKGKLSIQVHDTGIGIADDQRDRIFDEFYQVNNPERDRQQGLGLGLSIVERAARLLGHSLTLASTLGKGSVFTVTVPIGKLAMLEAENNSRSFLPPDLSGRLIAIIENENHIRIGLQNLLQSWRGRVVAADSAANMFSQLESLDRKPDLIISDFGLSGGLNGIEAIAGIRQRWGMDTPALVFTGNISKETYHLARDAGVSILYKPASTEALSDAIAAALGLGSIRTEQR